MRILEKKNCQEFIRTRGCHVLVKMSHWNSGFWVQPAKRMLLWPRVYCSLNTSICFFPIISWLLKIFTRCFIWNSGFYSLQEKYKLFMHTMHGNKWKLWSKLSMTKGIPSLLWFWCPFSLGRYNPKFCARNVQMGHHMQNQRAGTYHQHMVSDYNR
jgi:hypothetical protein